MGGWYTTGTSGPGELSYMYQNNSTSRSVTRQFALFARGLAKEIENKLLPYSVKAARPFYDHWRNGSLICSPKLVNRSKGSAGG